jgi:hypothetical protein
MNGAAALPRVKTHAVIVIECARAQRPGPPKVILADGGERFSRRRGRPMTALAGSAEG